MGAGRGRSRRAQWSRGPVALPRPAAAAQLPNPYVDDEGAKRWYDKSGRLHRVDGPAVESLGGTKEWWQQGRIHRIGAPAMEYADGTKEWWENGKGHRVDGPAVEYADGTKEWYLNGELHRLDGPARKSTDGRDEWYLYHQPVNEATVVLARQGEPAATYQNAKWYEFVHKHKLERVNACQYCLGRVPQQLTNAECEKTLAELFVDAVVADAITLPSPYAAKDFGFRITSVARGGNGRIEYEGASAEIFLVGKPEVKEAFKYDLPFYLEEYGMEMGQTGTFDVSYQCTMLVNTLIVKAKK